MLPELLRPGDPCAGDEALFEPGDFGNYQHFGRGSLDADAYRALEQTFHDAVGAWLEGRLGFESLRPLAAALAVDHPFGHDRRPLLPAPVVLPDEVLADVAEDQVAEAAFFLERLSGDPFAPATVGLYAAMAWVPYMDNGRRPVDAWDDEEDRDRPLVIAARAIERAPPCVWVDGGPLLPLSPRFCPPGGPAGAYVARAYRVGEGWAWSSRVALPAVPDREALLRRLTVEGWQIRRQERRSTWEDVLRRSPALVYRAAAEGAWRASHNFTSRQRRERAPDPG